MHSLCCQINPQDIEQLKGMQQRILRMISLVSNKAAEEKMEEVEELSETLHGLEVTFVKMYYSKKARIGDNFDAVCDTIMRRIISRKHHFHPSFK